MLRVFLGVDGIRGPRYVLFDVLAARGLRCVFRMMLDIHSCGLVEMYGQLLKKKRDQTIREKWA
jgi:hypothetical protein